MKFTEIGQCCRAVWYKDGDHRIAKPVFGSFCYGTYHKDACGFNATFPINDKYYRKDYLIDGACDIKVESFARAKKDDFITIFRADIIEGDVISNIRDSCYNLAIGGEYKHIITGHYEFDYNVTFDIEVTFIKIRFGLLIKSIRWSVPFEQATDWTTKFNNYCIQRS